MTLAKKIRLVSVAAFALIIACLSLGSFICYIRNYEEQVYGDLDYMLNTAIVLFTQNSEAESELEALKEVGGFFEAYNANGDLSRVDSLWAITDDPIERQITIYGQSELPQWLKPSDYLSAISKQDKFQVTAGEVEQYYVLLRQLPERKLILGIARSKPGLLNQIKNSLVCSLPLFFLFIALAGGIFIYLRLRILHFIAAFNMRLIRMVSDNDYNPGAERERLYDEQEGIIARIRAMQSNILSLLKEAQEDKNKAEAVLKSITEGVVIVNVDKRIISLNNLAERILGSDATEVTGREFSDIFRFSDVSSHEPVPSVIETVLLSKREIEIKGDIQLLTKNNGGCLVALRASPILDKYNRVVEIIVVLRDITQEVIKTESLKNTNELLRNNAECLQLILEAIKIATWEFEPVSLRLSASREFYEILHITEPDVDSLYDDMLERVVNKDALLQLFDPAREYSNNKFAERLEVAGDDGMRRWILCSGKKNYSLDGPAAGLVRGIIIDITNYITIENELESKSKLLHTNTKRLQQVYDLAKLFFWEYDRVNDRITGDRNFLRLALGLEEEGASAPLSELFKVIEPNYHNIIKVALAKAYKNKEKSCVLEFATVADATGKVRVLRDFHKFEYSQAGEPIASYGVVLDITEEHDKQVRLIHASKMESIGTLAGGIAHDFNNLLSAITSILDSLEKCGTKQDLKVIRYCREIRKIVVGAAEFTNNLLSFSRKRSMEFEEICLNELLKNTIVILRHSISSQIEVESERVPESIRLWGNFTELQNSLLNLGINSRDTIMEKSAKLDSFSGKINFRVRECKGSMIYGKVVSGNILPELYYVIIEVADNGFGIKPSCIDSIFEPFFTTKPQEKGTGLGLAIIDETIQAHEGAIMLDSEVGEGTVFSIILPKLEVEEVEQESENSTKESARISGRLKRGSSKGVFLIVDDEAVMRVIYNQLLLEQGYMVLEAENGRDGVGKYQEYHDSIKGVIMDLKMPDMDGREAFKEIRAIDAQAKVVFVSAYLDDVLERELLEMGAEDALKKPFRKRSFVHNIEQIFGR